MTAKYRVKKIRLVGRNTKNLSLSVVCSCVYPVDHEKRLKASKCKRVRIGNLSVTAFYYYYYYHHHHHHHHHYIICFSQYLFSSKKKTNNHDQIEEHEIFFFFFSKNKTERTEKNDRKGK